MIDLGQNAAAGVLSTPADRVSAFDESRRCLGIELDRAAQPGSASGDTLRTGGRDTVIAQVARFRPGRSLATSSAWPTSARLVMRF